MSLSIIGRQTYVNTNYNVQQDDEVLLFSLREGAIDCYLPSLETMRKGYGFRMKDESGQAHAFPITFHGDGAEEIQGSSTFVMNLNYAQIDIVAAGDKWIILSSHNPSLPTVSEGGTGADNPMEAVQNLVLEIRDPVRVAAKTPVSFIALPTTVNGVTLADGDDVLLWLQPSAYENGIYRVVDASGGVWERREDFNEASDFTRGLQVLALEGNSYAGVYFVNNTNAPVIGTDAISFTPLNDATAVYDPYGNKVFGYDYSADDVNFLRAEATPLGNNARLRAWSDSETHVGGSLDAKGNGRWTGLQLIEINDTTDISDASNVTYSVSAACGSLINRDPNGVDRTDTLPTAADLIAHIPNAFARQSFRLTIANIADAAETITLGTNTGLTLVGNFEIAQGETKQFLFYIADTAAMGEGDTIVVYSLGGSGGSSISVGNGLTESGGTVSVDLGSEFQFVGTSIYAKAISDSKQQEFIANRTGSTLVSGTAVTLHANADGTMGAVPADCDTGLIATHIVGGLDIANNTSGFVVKSVNFGSLDTSAALAVGSPLYLSTSGGYVFDFAPSGANKVKQVIGRVLAVDGSSGVISFRPELPTLLGNEPSYTEETLTSPAKRLYLNPGTFSGADPDVGATLVQATTGATGTVTKIHDDTFAFDLSSVTGNFDDTHVVTGTNVDTSTFTITPSLPTVDRWTLNNPAIGFSNFTSNDGAVLSMSSKTRLLTAGKVRFQSSYDRTDGQVETLESDGWTSVTVGYTK